MLSELQTEKTMIIDRCFQKYSLNSCLVCSFISLGTVPFLLYTQLTLHAPREQYLLLSINFKALCGVCNTWEV